MTEHAAAVGNWNLPNVLTGLRILLVPVFGFALLHDGGDAILWRCLATLVFAVAMVTDKVDGDIARSRGKRKSARHPTMWRGCPLTTTVVFPSLTLSATVASESSRSRC